MLFLSSAAVSRAAPMEDLIVVVRSHVLNEDRIGTGIIFGASSDRLYIFTANHNVRAGANDAESVSVQLKWLPDEHLKATLLQNSDAALDVAVLTVQAPDSTPILHYDVLGDPSSLQPGDDVYSLGHPNGNLWQTNMKPDSVSSTKFDSIYFQSNFIGPGQSGGALLDGNHRLVGMILKDEPPHGEARSVDRVLQWLEQYDYPLQLSTPGTPSNLAEFENSIREDVLYNCTALSNWPGPDSKPEVRQTGLLTVLKRVESDPRYRNMRSPVIADLYRCLGGSQLIVEGEVWEKVPKALPYLHRSIKANPDQPLLKQNIAYFEAFMQVHEGNARDVITNSLQILRGDDSNIKTLTDQMMENIASPEFQAKQWLMHDATRNPPLQNWLDAVSMKIKRENNLDAPVEVTSSTLPDGLVQVQAKVGPNVFLWTVDYNNRKYVAKNKLTEDFMTLVEKPKQ
jgi:hypothetical protein